MSIMQALGFPSEGVAKGKLLAAVRDVGATRMNAAYSGGNDEGGVNDIDLFDADGGKMETPDYYTYRAPKPGDDSWAIRDGKVAEFHPLWEAANGMLATEFGSWAGEFEAYGTLYADLKENRVWREGEIQSGYDSDSAEY